MSQDRFCARGCGREVSFEIGFVIVMVRQAGIQSYTDFLGRRFGAENRKQYTERTETRQRRCLESFISLFSRSHGDELLVALQGFCYVRRSGFLLCQ